MAATLPPGAMLAVLLAFLAPIAGTTLAGSLGFTFGAVVTGAALALALWLGLTAVLTTRARF